MQSLFISSLNGSTTYIPSEFIKISFDPFIQYIDELSKAEKGPRHRFYHFILKKFSAYHLDSRELAVTSMVDYSELLELMFVCLSGDLLAKESQKLLGLSVPLHPFIFYGTHAFYNTFNAFLNGNTKPDETKMRRQQEVAMIQQAIAQKLYGFPMLSTIKNAAQFIDPETGVEKFYKIVFDHRFVNIYLKPGRQLLDKALLANAMLEEETSNGELPINIDDYIIEGITAVELSDVTVMHVVENIQSFLLNGKPCTDEACSLQLNNTLHVLLESRDVHCNLIPLLSLNGKWVKNH